MKFALMLTISAVAAIFSSSCRTACPLDPLSMRPDCGRCTIHTDPSGCCGHTETFETVTYSNK